MVKRRGTAGRARFRVRAQGHELRYCRGDQRRRNLRQSAVLQHAIDRFHCRYCAVGHHKREVDVAGIDEAKEEYLNKKYGY